MGNLGFGELLLILVVVLLIFGSSKLPQLGDALGKGIKNFRKATSGDDAIDVTPRKDASPSLGQGSTPAQKPAAPAQAPAEKK